LRSIARLLAHPKLRPPRPGPEAAAARAAALLAAALLAASTAVSAAISSADASPLTTASAGGAARLAEPDPGPAIRVATFRG
jgi:hypothetical protein